MYTLSEDNNRNNEIFIQFSRLRNGLINELLDEHYKKNVENSYKFKIYRIFELIFMSLMLIRILISIQLSDDDYRLVYIGRTWHYMGVNHLHFEVPLLFWTLLFIGVYGFVIRSPTQYYKWLEIFEFLNGNKPNEQIGKNFLNLYCILIFMRQIKLNDLIKEPLEIYGNY
jgi:hypothetical protein